MRNVTENFKIDIRTYGRQLDFKIKVNDADFNVNNLNYIKPAFNTPLFKTVMHQVEIDSKLYMPKDTKVYIKVGVKVNEKNYKYVELGTYYVKSCERQEDTNSYRILAYTKMKNAMVDYDLTISENITVRNYLIAICERLSWNTENIPATFINSTKLVSPSLHTGINYTFRDALDEIATITCSFLLFKNDDFYLSYLTNTNETIDESYLDEDNITIGEKYLINSLVFSRAEESDNIYRKDDDSIETNGLHEYRISDCQLLSKNDRDDYIDEMFNYLKTLEFYIFDIQSKGILFLEACDMFNLVLNGVTYPVALLNNEINIEDGLTENLYMDEPDETETEYKYADSTDKKINQTILLVDKQNQQIKANVQSINEQNEKISETIQNVDENRTTITDIQKTSQELIQTIEELQITIEGLKNTLKTTGGSNLIRNSVGFFGNDNSLEYWEGNAIGYTDNEIKNNNVSKNAIRLQNSDLLQKVMDLKNGTYNLSFNYKKRLSASNVSFVVNDNTTEEETLSSEVWNTIEKVIEIKDNYFSIKFSSDTDNSCDVSDLILTYGENKQTWSQNSNETQTDTVSIGKGVQVESSTMNTYTRIDADGNRTINSLTGDVVMETTDKEIYGLALRVRDNANLCGLLHQTINNQIAVNFIE